MYLISVKISKNVSMSVCVCTCVCVCARDRVLACTIHDITGRCISKGVENGSGEEKEGSVRGGEASCQRWMAFASMQVQRSFRIDEQIDRSIDSKDPVSLSAASLHRFC